MSRIDRNPDPASDLESEIAVVALGSPHGLDQIGWLIADELQRQQPSGVVIQRLHSPWEVIDYCSGLQSLMVIDACLSGAPPGTATWISRDSLTASLIPRSSHGIDLKSVLDLADTLGRTPRRLAILGIEITSTIDETPLDPRVIEAIPECIERIQRQFADWNKVCKLEER